MAQPVASSFDAVASSFDAEHVNPVYLDFRNQSSNKVCASDDGRDVVAR